MKKLKFGDAESIAILVTKNLVKHDVTENFGRIKMIYCVMKGKLLFYKKRV